MIPTDEIYYADNEGIICTTANDFSATMETHKLKCANCRQVFFTQVPVVGIRHGMVACPNCGRCVHDILEPDFPGYKYTPYKRASIRTKSSDLYDSLLYAAQEMNKKRADDFTMSVEEVKKAFNMEDKNMKRTENEEKKDQNITITRRYDTSRGVFTVSQLEPTDMFVLIDDEDQTVYMAVYEEDPKYKTKQAVVDMHSGNLLYLDISTKIHVYKAGCELRVGEFIWTSEGYN